MPGFWTMYLFPYSVFSPLIRAEIAWVNDSVSFSMSARKNQVRPISQVGGNPSPGILVDFRRWMEQLEFAVRSHPGGDRVKVEEEVIEQLAAPALPTVKEFFERFESAAGTVPEDLQPLHRSYVKRQLHPLVLCAPFSWRTFYKPLGYAGDYEMVNMMLRQPYEGSSMFAKVLNTFFLNTAPVLAHRNRINYLVKNLKTEIARVQQAGRKARIFYRGCGPAPEIQPCWRMMAVVGRMRVLLAELQIETLRNVGEKSFRKMSERNVGSKYRDSLKSVHQILREAARPGGGFELNSYDVVYCAGLFDYLSDKI